ncbi:hypothetical protein C4S77_03440 [Apibacter adventoris]|uniref:Uncharacterized protein n=1 Tax=Apibacter adventoris TaxID=1679466 RepID=A0A2S8AF03_9FLAO|nr:hypothetical protein C4S77_03440 [Apibacter adventoris]
MGILNLVKSGLLFYLTMHGDSNFIGNPLLQNNFYSLQGNIPIKKETYQLTYINKNSTLAENSLGIIKTRTFNKCNFYLKNY